MRGLLQDFTKSWIKAGELNSIISNATFKKHNIIYSDG